MRIVSICIIVFGLLSISCAHTERARIPDGLYIQDDEGKSPLKVKVVDLQNNIHQFSVKEFKSFTPTNVVVYSLRPYENVVQVQIDGVSSDLHWSKEMLMLVVNEIPYLELTKSSPGGLTIEKQSPMAATLTLKCPSEEEASALATRIKKKFEIE